MGIPEELRRDLIQSAKEIIPRFSRESFAVSCWHINEFEAESFWRIYSQRGIAIQTTFGNLKKSFENNAEYNIYIGKIEYKDHNSEIVDIGNLFNSVLWKRKSFEYENELRAVVWEKDNSNGKGARSFDENGGQYIGADLTILVENIYTTPFEKSDRFNNITKDLIKRYGFDFPCIKSNLMEGPFK